MEQPRRVLLINSFGREFAPWDAFAGNFRTELLRRSAQPPDIYEVSLETARLNDPEDGPYIEYLITLFAGRRLDLVVPIGGPAVRFAQRHRPQIFTNTPMLMAAVDERHVRPAALTTNDTVAAVRNEPTRTLDNLLHVLPQTTNVVVLLGNSPVEQFWVGEFQREFKRYEDRACFTWLTGMSFAEMVKHCASLPPRSAILYVLLAVDATGAPNVEERVLTALHAGANAPIFGFQGSQMGRGIVGGPLMPVDELARNTAAVAVRILGGEKPARIQTPAQMPGPPEFDWRELQRWGIPESTLPPGSIVRFRKPSLWQEYKGRIFAIGALVIAQALVISALLANLIKRRRAERSLSESEVRFQIAADSAPVMLWMAGIDKRCTFLNKAWLAFTGRTLEQEMGNGWTQGVHLDDLAGCLKTYEKSFDARAEFSMEYRLRRHNGEYAWVIDTGFPRFTADGTFQGYIGAATDITPIKMAQERWRAVVEGSPNAMLVTDDRGKITMVNERTEAVFGYSQQQMIGMPVEMLVPVMQPNPQAIPAGREVFGLRNDGSRVPLEIGLSSIRTTEGKFVLASIIDITARHAAEMRLRESEQRMTMAAEAAHLGMWIWEAPDICMWTSAKWKELHGYAAEEEIRFDQVMQRVHPEDRAAVERTVTAAVEEQSAFHVQHRLLLPDQTLRWISMSGRVEPMADGRRKRLMGISMDISERVEVEQAAREVSGKLITAQEDERRRIARDLHDDLNQQLALLSVETDLLGHMENNAPARALISDIAARVRDLSSEVHKLSYQLHPAKLDQLGLVAATRSFCLEVSKQCGFSVEFIHDDIPRGLNQTTALSLYRIAQEALQNVMKHSRATSATVELRQRENKLTLRISDNGCGFDTKTINQQAGLGLVGMRERVRLVHGEILFRAIPGNGTSIEVMIPLVLNEADTV